ncbi:MULTISPECIES: hypothetical protein [Streptomyces]|uniref:hypothetical protein n=1 Tax=Streptomyces TaxID=1883 RepID=UPI0006E37B0E|nr:MULTISPECIES: hypothetical protein [Streptomyces]
MTVIPKDVVLQRQVTPKAETSESMESLRGDCARMVPHWAVPAAAAAAPVPPSLIHGITVPPSSARLIGEMSEYGD